MPHLQYVHIYSFSAQDAAICCKFHLERERNPQKFNNRMKNKLWYFEYATSEQFSSSCKNLQEDVEIIVSSFFFFVTVSVGVCVVLVRVARGRVCVGLLHPDDQRRSVLFQCDGVPLNLTEGPTLQGIALLNIPSTHGGTNMWGDSKTRRIKKKRKKKSEKNCSLSSFTDHDLSQAVQGK